VARMQNLTPNSVQLLINSLHIKDLTTKFDVNGTFLAGYLKAFGKSSYADQRIIELVKSLL
jgi:hypothetical protein